MGPIEKAWATSLTRRRALMALSGMFAAGPTALTAAQVDPRHFRDSWRAPGIDEMVDAFDFEEIAYLNLPRQVYDYTAQGAHGEWTARRNRYIFDFVEIVERPEARVSPDEVDAST